MTVRIQHTEPWHASQGPSTEKKPMGDKVPVKSRVAGMHNSGIEPDTLHSALGVKALAPLLPKDMTVYEHTRVSRPTGAHYNPTESFRKVSPTHTKEGRGYSYGGAPNKKGDNPLGKAMNKVGQKSGYGHFKPRGGGKNV